MYPPDVSTSTRATDHPPVQQFKIGKGDQAYLWVDNWARIPNRSSVQRDGRTHAIAVSEQGNVIIFHQAAPAVLIFDHGGKCIDAWGDRFPGAHGLTLVKEGTEELLWLADSSTGEVAKTTLSGQTVLSLPVPDLSIYQTQPYKPTGVTVDEERFGGSGDIWVSDGYGADLVHRYDKSGRYRQSINGSEGDAGLFACPHSVWLDIRKLEPELYIADRGNCRVQVYDLDGSYLRAFGTGFLTSPCAFAAHNDTLIIPELCGRVTLLDGQDHLIRYLGENEAVCEVEGWPNLPADLIVPGRFNSPHAVATDAVGNIYVAEWLIGGRITKLVKRLVR